MSEEKNNSFKVLNDLNLSNKLKEKIGLKYLSWADAWTELKKIYPNASYKIYSREVKITDVREDGGTKVTSESTSEVPYFTDGKTAYVKVGVIVEGVEYVELLPVMDNRNQSVMLSMITMTAVNKAIQRAFVKACARHGLGLYVYAGEDLPDADKKVIDFTDIQNNCDRYATTELSEEGFAKMRNDVINLIQNEVPSLQEDCQKAITDYVVSVAKGKRISTFTLAEDNVSLQRIYNFIHGVKKALAAPANGK